MALPLEVGYDGAKEKEQCLNNQAMDTEREESDEPSTSRSCTRIRKDLTASSWNGTMKNNEIGGSTAAVPACCWIVPVNARSALIRDLAKHYILLPHWETYQQCLCR